MTIRAQIIADSVSAEGHRLTTFQLRYPRFVHAELMTHRLFSRNASSSRAIPVKKMIEDLRRDPAVPIHWGANQPGMQARAELDDEAKAGCQGIWLQTMEHTIDKVEMLVAAGLHKQVANRLLEPWGHINVVLTATQWANWFALRDHPDALPEIAALAGAMRQCQERSEPVFLNPGQWHLPYIRPEDADAILDHHDDEIGDHLLETMKKVSVARCARVSYLTHEGKPTSIEKDLVLYYDLVGSAPLHASPAEHQATPDAVNGQKAVINATGQILDTRKPELGRPVFSQMRLEDAWANEHEHGNFTGWRQLRKMLPNECVHQEPYRASQTQTYVA